MNRDRPTDQDRGLAAVLTTTRAPDTAAVPAAAQHDGRPTAVDTAVPSGPGAVLAERLQPTRRRFFSPGSRAVLAAVAIAVLVGPLAMAAGISSIAAPAGPSSAKVATAEELEAAYGIRIRLVALIASGGVVNVRFTVVDPDKAQHLLDDSPPALYVQSTGAVLRTNVPRTHKMAVLAGASYFLLYPNSGGVVRAGTPVSVFVDRLLLEPVSAQG